MTAPQSSAELTQPASKRSHLGRSKILGTGHYLPQRILTNEDLEKMVDTNDQWIVERTGIKERHLAAPGELTTDLAYHASVRALESAELKAEDLDMIIFATVTGDQRLPSSACVLQHKLGANHVMAFDLSAACTGFVYALSVADQFIKTGIYKRILVVGAEILQSITNYKDRETCILFGDAAGCMILGAAEENEHSNILSTHMHSDGSLGDLFTLPGGGSAIPFSQRVLDENLHFMHMKGREIFKNAVRTMTQCCQEALDANGMTHEQIDWLIPHQANIRILDSVAHYFKIPSSKVIVTLDRTGNTSTATIPTSFDMAVRDGRIQRGQYILLTAFGAGLTSGSVLLRY